MAWTPAEAHRFLRAIPAFEAAGLVVRVPDWWRPRRPPRPEVTVRVGEKKPSALGMDALLDFSVAVALGDEKLTAAEVRQLLASSERLGRRPELAHRSGEHTAELQSRLHLGCRLLLLK